MKKVIFLLVGVLLIGGLVYGILNKGENNPNDGVVEDNSNSNIGSDKDGIIEGNPESDTNLDNGDEIEDNSSQDAESDDGPIGIEFGIVDTKVEIEVDKEIPDFILQDLKGNNVRLSDYKGKIVWINFWASWCKFCDLEMPDLQRMKKENEDIVLLAVNVKERKSTAETYIKKGGYDFDVLLDVDGKVSNHYLVSGLPANYFIDKEGKFLGRIEGMLTYEQMNEVIDSLRKN